MHTQLGGFSADARRVTVSGLSSGAFMAHQLHVAYSDLFKGAAFIAGGPYYASRGSLGNAMWSGFDGSQHTDVSYSVDVAHAASANEQIASLDNLRSSPVWVFHGAGDEAIQRSSSDAMVAFYGAVGHKGKLKVVYDVDVGHAMPITASASDEDELPAFVSACGFDAAGSLLRHLHGPLKRRADKASGELRTFSQGAFTATPRWHGLADDGLIYLPSAALDGEACGLHVALHGCQQTMEDVGDGFARRAGYNEWAEANKLIVLYPQATRTHHFAAFNPLGSWDWWGYSDSQFHLRSGAQMATIAAMVRTLCA